MIGLFKRRIKYRTHSQPEKTMVLDYLLRCSLSKFKLAAAQRPKKEQLRDAAELKEHMKVVARQQRGCNLQFDSGSGEQGRLLGKGADLTVPQQHKEGLLQLLPAEQRGVWEERWSDVKLYEHKAAHLPDGSYCTSASFGKGRTRLGSYALVGYFQGDAVEVTPYVAHVQKYWRLVLPSAGDAATAQQQLRVAICDLLPAQPPCEDPRICEYVLYAADVPRADRIAMPHNDARKGQIDCMEVLHRVDAPLLVARYRLREKFCMAFTPIRFGSGGNRSRALV
jgi:hypothetical protein